LQLTHARKVFWIRAVFGQLKRGEVINALDFLVERLFKFEAIR